MSSHPLTIRELLVALDSGRTTAVATTEKLFSFLEEREPQIGAYITLCKDDALAQAGAADEARRAGRPGPLCGVPVSLKDVFCTQGVQTTCGSKILQGFIPPYDATVVERLKDAGAVIVGKVAMDEFAMGSSTENCAYTVPKNPWNTAHVCGGSSGGSAASVAAGLCFASLGSDTGGSIRQPASHCGVVGLKPTYGRVSRYGLVAFASSLDQVGPFTRDVYDCALMLSVIAGHDRRDSTSVDSPVPDYTRFVASGLRGLVVGVPKEYFAAGLDAEVEKTVRHALELLEDGGAVLREVSLPHSELCLAVYYIIAPAEACSNLARYDGVRFGLRDRDADTVREMFCRTRSKGFGAEVKRRILIGSYALSSGYYDAYYRKASQVRTLIAQDFQNAFKDCDVLVSPVAPQPAWKFGEKSDDPLAMYLSDILTISTNLAGIPGMSVPGGLSAAGLPIGIQLQANHFREDLLFRVAAHIEAGVGRLGTGLVAGAAS